MAIDFKTLTDYVPVMVAVVGVANTLAKYLLKKGSPENLRAEAEEEKSDTLAEGKSDLDLITAQLDDILGVLKEIAREGKRQAEMEAYLERCREERKGIE
jgi:hypothetical protein